MANKIKITEGQLKKIMTNRINENDYQDYLDTNYAASGDSYEDESPKRQNKEIASKLFEVGKLMWDLGLKDEAEKYKIEAASWQNPDFSTFGTEHYDDVDLKSYWENNTDSPNHVNPSVGDDDEIVYESIKKIKSEFNRFL
jgi:hypothetical protein